MWLSIFRSWLMLTKILWWISSEHVSRMSDINFQVILTCTRGEIEFWRPVVISVVKWPKSTRPCLSEFSDINAISSGFWKKSPETTYVQATYPELGVLVPDTFVLGHVLWRSASVLGETLLRDVFADFAWYGVFTSTLEAECARDKFCLGEPNSS